MVMLRRFRGSYCGRSRERHDAAASKLSRQAFVKNECERHVVGMNRKVNRLFTVYEGNASVSSKKWRLFKQSSQVISVECIMRENAIGDVALSNLRVSKERA